MSHISGNFTYDFTRVETTWGNSLETGINSMVIGMTCTFTGQDSFGVQQEVMQYIDGTTGFGEPNITLEYANTYAENICNTFASGQNWFYNLQNQVSGMIDHPVQVTGFNPDVHPVPPADTEGEHHL